MALSAGSLAKAYNALESLRITDFRQGGSFAFSMIIEEPGDPREVANALQEYIRLHADAPDVDPENIRVTAARDGRGFIQANMEIWVL